MPRCDILWCYCIVAVSEQARPCAGRNRSPVDSKRPNLPAQAQHLAPKPGVKASKQTAVANMFKAAKASQVSSRPAPALTATYVTGSGNRGQGTMAQESGSHHKSTEDMQHGKLVATANALSHTEAELGCGGMTPGRAAQQYQSSVVDLGKPQGNIADAAEAHHRAEQNCSEAGLSHAAVGQLQGHSTDAASEDHDALRSIDLAEQKQILHDLWLEKNALSARVSAKRPVPASTADNKRAKLASGNSRQTQIFSMLKKPP